MDVRGDGRDAMADGGAGAVNSEGFLVDILGEPEALERVAGAYGDRRLQRRFDRPRLLLIGMGSSGYAAGTAVAALRSRGLDAHAELASTGLAAARLVALDLERGAPFADRFDLVLVDAPCTGLGTIRRDVDIRWRRHEEDLITCGGWEG